MRRELRAAKWRRAGTRPAVIASVIASTLAWGSCSDLRSTPEPATAADGGGDSSRPAAPPPDVAPSSPANGSVPPTDGSAAPADGSVPASQGSVPPTDGSAAPADAPTAGDGPPSPVDSSRAPADAPAPPPDLSPPPIDAPLAPDRAPPPPPDAPVCTGEGAPCPTGNPCTTGAFVCNGGVRVCMPSNRPEATRCADPSCGGRDLTTYACRGDRCEPTTTRCPGRCASAVASCEACGGSGEPCCETPTAPCRGSSLTCQAGRCMPCGALGQACCPSGCNGGFPCEGGTCVCGGNGQPCCPDDRCQLASQVCLSNRMPGRTPTDPPVDPTLEGRCWPCGFVQGNPCCAGDTCMDPQLFCADRGDDGIRRCGH